MYLLKIKFNIFSKRYKNSYYKKLNVSTEPKVMHVLKSFDQLQMVKNVLLKCKASDMLFITSQSRVYSLTSLPRSYSLFRWMPQWNTKWWLCDVNVQNKRKHVSNHSVTFLLPSFFNRNIYIYMTVLIFLILSFHCCSSFYFKYTVSKEL